MPDSENQVYAIFLQYALQFSICKPHTGALAALGHS